MPASGEMAVSSRVVFGIRRPFFVGMCIASWVLLLCVSCASFSEKHSRTLLLNRNTGEIKECTVDRWRTEQSYKAYQECIGSYEKQGYSIWNQY
ncbi:hypothetical protein DPPLL_37030 [Desulfofustis limnaeus]|uniref:Lipoprotein n=2 Tax=Desulfofustis limnaeus TaxID=2740163 RepID=A0ABN6MCN1_9BACT|nr:hypothetical protein DPPLL_37030 [Desulfofustis limnaeus]